MNVSTRMSRVLPLVVLMIAGATAIACGNRDEPTPSPTAPPEGIPAPDASLTDASAPSAFFHYGDSLRFASDTPGYVVINRTMGGRNSELRVRSEVRLPFTTSAAYGSGRIIAKFETVGAASNFGVPAGVAYLWVRDSSGHHVGKLISRDYVSGAYAVTGVASMLHSFPRVITAVRSMCISLDDQGDSVPPRDTARLCCLCGDGQFNCASSVVTSQDVMDSLLTRHGFTRRP
ncbi:MAG: hypothetical protein ABI852_07480 [Gemmatimonadaceae bacterium]